MTNHKETSEHARHAYKPGYVANYMLDMAEAEGKSLTLLKLLKLVYIGYGWSAAVLDEKLFDEPIQAWAHGPVIPSLYHEFKHYGATGISGRAEEFDLDNRHPCGKTGAKKCQPQDLSADVQKILGVVWGIYKEFSAWDLRKKTHENGTPWKSVYVPGRNDIEIPYERIKTHFGEKIDDYIKRIGK